LKRRESQQRASAAISDAPPPVRDAFNEEPGTPCGTIRRPQAAQALLGVLGALGLDHGVERRVVAAEPG
jgi:hypothetical protein